MTEPITVLVADDHAVFRAGLKAVIDAGPDTSCVAEADDGRAAIEAAQRVQPAVVVLDVRMPRLDGVAAIEPIIAVYRFIADDATRTAELDTAVSALADEYLIDGRMEWKYLLAVGRRAAPLALS